MLREIQKKKWKSLSHYVTYVVWCKGNSFQDCAIKSFLLGLCCTKSAQQPFTGHNLLPSEKCIFTKVLATEHGLRRVLSWGLTWGAIWGLTAIVTEKYLHARSRRDLITLQSGHFGHIYTTLRHPSMKDWRKKFWSNQWVCVCWFLAGVVSALAQWIDVLQINHHWCPDTWHMIST